MVVPFGVTYEKIGTIQRRLAWPLHKDDTLFRVEALRSTIFIASFFLKLFVNWVTGREELDAVRWAGHGPPDPGWFCSFFPSTSNSSYLLGIHVGLREQCS